MSSSNLRTRIGQARLGRLVLVYAGASWAVLEATDFFINRFGLPEWFIPAALVLLLVGFIVFIATALVQARQALGTSTGDPDAARGAGEIGGADSGLPRLLTWRNALIGGAFAFGLWGVVATGWLLLRGDGRIGDRDMKSIAVLPFANMSADADNEYFSDGITDDIITHLSKIADLTVISRTSVMRYKNTEKSIREIGEELGVAAILEGGVRRSGDQVRINAQLIDTETDAHLWAEIYDRQLTNVFAIQSDVAQQIASALQATLTPAEKERIERKPTDNLEAYDYYLRGNAFFDRFGYSVDATLEAERLYRKALELDPSFASAWSQLSRAHSGLYWGFFDRSSERLAMAREAFERAFEIEPDLPAAHVAAGFFYYYGSRDYESALREFEAALAAEPNNADALEGSGWIQRRLGRWEQAFATLERVVELDPRSTTPLLTLAETAYYDRRYEDAERYLLRTLALTPGDAQASRLLAWVSASWHGDADTARAFVEAALDADPVALPGADDLQSWWLVRVAADNSGDLLGRLSLESFGGDTITYLLSLADLERRRGHVDAVRAAYAAAVSVLEKKLAANPEEPRYHSELGVALAGIGRREEAIRAGQRAIELLPVERDVLWGRAFVDNLALIYAQVGDIEAASEQLMRSLDLAGPLTRAWIRVDPAWDSLRDEPLFQSLLRPDRSP